MSVMSNLFIDMKTKPKKKRQTNLHKKRKVHPMIANITEARKIPYPRNKANFFSASPKVVTWLKVCHCRNSSAKPWPRKRSNGGKQRNLSNHFLPSDFWCCARSDIRPRYVGSRWGEAARGKGRLPTGQGWLLLLTVMSRLQNASSRSSSG